MTDISTLLAKDKELREKVAEDPDSVSTAEMNALIKETRSAGSQIGAAGQREQLNAVLNHWGAVVEKREGYKPGLLLDPYDPEMAQETDQNENADADSAASESALTYTPGEAAPAAEGVTLAQLFMKMPAYAKWGILVVLALFLAAVLYSLLTPDNDEVMADPAATETAVVAAITASAQPTGTAAPTATPRMYIEPETAVPAESAPVGTSTPIVYVVQTQDNLNKIARKYGVTVQDIAILNNIYNVNNIAVGQELLIPTPGPGTSLPVDSAVDSTPSAPGSTNEAGMQTTSSTSPPLPELVIRGAEAVDLRIAAGPDYQAITSLPPGTFAAIIAKTPNGEWYLIQLADGYTRGWVPAANTALLYPANPETLPTTPMP